MPEKKLYSKLFEQSFSAPMKITYWDGSEQYIAGAVENDYIAEIVINKKLEWKELLSDASIALAEAYMRKDIEVNGDLKAMLVNAFQNELSFLENSKFKHLVKHHMRRNKEENLEDIEYHYDIGNSFYRYWLDDTFTYSCGYFKTEEDSLEDAQWQKAEHILRKLRLKKGDHLLDIGCGWGTLILAAAKYVGVKATGYTLSIEQKNYIDKKIKELGLEDQVNVELKDYRDDLGTGLKFNKIVSVGMFEHVGKADIPNYFSAINELLEDEGLALIHGISGQRDVDDETKGNNGFLNKYIFPGGYIPSLTEIIDPINKEGMHLIDLESLRRHYSLTLDRWSENFRNAWDDILETEDVDEEFMRMWDLYLISTSAIFKSGNLDVCQYLIEKGADNTRPLTREYMSVTKKLNR